MGPWTDHGANTGGYYKCVSLCLWPCVGVALSVGLSLVQDAVGHTCHPPFA